MPPATRQARPWRCEPEELIKSKIPYMYHPTNNEKLQDPQAIANTFSCYYSSLYNIKEDSRNTQYTPESINQFLDCINLPSLCPSQLTNLNTPFTSSVISKAIHSLPNCKCPGPDGLIGEYYKFLKDTLAPCNTIYPVLFSLQMGIFLIVLYLCIIILFFNKMFEQNK